MPISARVIRGVSENLTFLESCPCHANEGRSVVAVILDREAELIALAEAEADAGVPGEEELSLAVVRALLRLILSPNVRMPLSRLQ
jgi:hypothetical protein